MIGVQALGIHFISSALRQRGVDPKLHSCLDWNFKRPSHSFLNILNINTILIANRFEEPAVIRVS